MSEVKTFKAMAIPPPESKAMEGPKIDINKLFGREIVVHRFCLEPSKLPPKVPGVLEKCLWLQITLNGAKHVLFSGSRYLQFQIQKIPADGFPFSTTIVKKDNDSHQFT